jgi:hypothetical protein
MEGFTPENFPIKKGVLIDGTLARPLIFSGFVSSTIYFIQEFQM